MVPKVLSDAGQVLNYGDAMTGDMILPDQSRKA